MINLDISKRRRKHGVFFFLPREINMGINEKSSNYDRKEKVIMEKVAFDENYRKAESFIDENAEKWIKEFGLDEEKIKDIKSVMTACQFLGVDITTFPGFEELV